VKGPVRTAHILLIMTVLGTVAPSAVILRAWQWPVDQVGFLDSQAAVREDSVFSFVFRMRNGLAAELRSPVEGSVVFDRTGATGMNPGDPKLVPAVPSLVVDTPDGFRVFLDIEGLERPGDEVLFPRSVTSGQRLGTVKMVAVRVFDTRSHQYINPRTVFPFTADLPLEEIPVVRFFQNGVLLDSNTLRPGPARLVVPASAVVPSRLPKTIQVLRNGLLESYHEFIFGRDIVTRLSPSGDLMLADLTVSPGDNLLRLEASRFDGTVLRRNIRFSVDTEDPPLDTR